MFESDDYDQILSQFDFPDVSSEPQCNGDINKVLIAPALCNKNHSEKSSGISSESIHEGLLVKAPSNINNSHEKEISPKHTKRKLIDSYFDHKSKRKFPGPAGLLNSSFKENKDEQLGHMELLSQDVDFSQNCLHRDSFDLPLWSRLLEDVKDWKLGVIDSIKGIKQQAIMGNLRRRKADTVTAFIEAIDRSITDPLITLRDCTGSIKCTLHRDAWSKFSPYIVSEYCALVLWKPTVLTTGSAFKKHYLNITLSNIFAIYSSAVLNDDTSVELPNGYTIQYEEDFTVIKAEKPSSQIGTENSTAQPMAGSNGLFDGLDSIFDDDDF